ncbi:MAG: DUF4340 domain-containing protein [Candidatus Lambdaproteobacteria bacterium]|nr:DUF4340 domain-containing protein [Candidatus Lambdaproteobacteria bacterium]
MNLKLIAIVTAALVVVAAGGLVLKRKDEWSKAPERVGQPVLQAIDLGKVGRIYIEQDKEHATLLNAGKGLVVKDLYDFPADANKLTRFLTGLMNQKIASKVTDNPAHFGDLGVLTVAENGGKFESFKTASRFEVYDQEDKPLFRILLGKDRVAGYPPRSTGGQYVRFEDEKAAYLIPDLLTLDTKPEDWLDKAVFPGLDAKKELKRVTLTPAAPGKPALRFQRDKADGPWSLAGVKAEQLNDSEVTDLMQRIVELSVTKIAPPGRTAAQLGRERLATIDIETFDGRRLEVKMGEKDVDKDKEARYCTVRGEMLPGATSEPARKFVDALNTRFKDRTFAIYSWVGGRIFKEPKDFIKKKP